MSERDSYVTGLTATGSKNQFYPTPPSVAGKMLACVDWHFVESVLEPSAGKGDLVIATAKAFFAHNSRSELAVDVCEIDPYLRQICKYNISERYRESSDRYAELDDIAYSHRTEAQNAEYKKLKDERNLARDISLHVVHDDFLTYRTHKRYSLIIMNPPFAEGDLHLLKALEMQKEGGQIVCLLNAETIRNPYTASRQLLARKLREAEANVKYIDDAFRSDAERKANVDVAIVSVNVPMETKFESTIYDRMKKAVDAEVIQDAELHALVTGDYIEQAIQFYNVEVAATLELVREYNALCPYMSRELGGKDNFSKDPILTLVVERDSSYRGFDYNKYLRLVRLKYWRALMKNEKFTGKLTSKLREQYQETVEKMADYEFSAFNIKQVIAEMNASMQNGVENAIVELFDKLTVEHSWYPECSQNKHYFNGWKTNKAHKIGKKCIIPTCGMFSSYSWSKETFDVSTAYKTISDIEKAFNYLDGNMTAEYDLNGSLKGANIEGRTRNIQCKYFKIDLFKKGTTHIKFNPEAMDLVERLNIYAARKRAWLPPSYGKASYASMDVEEKAVVDSFQGEEAYKKVLARKDYYLSEPTQSVAALMPAT